MKVYIEDFIQFLQSRDFDETPTTCDQFDDTAHTEDTTDEVPLTNTEKLIKIYNTRVDIMYNDPRGTTLDFIKATAYVRGLLDLEE